MDEIAGGGSRLTFGGLATGLDTGAIIEALLDAERRPIASLQNQRSGLETQKSAVDTLSKNVLALREAAGRIDNRSSLFSGQSFDEELLQYKATSDDESKLLVEAVGSADPGSFSIEVDRLATTSREISNAFADPNAPLAVEGSSVSITYSGGNILLAPPAGTSLAEIRDLINTSEDNDGSVRATLLDDGIGTRLIVSGTEPGADNDVQTVTNIAGPGGLPFFDRQEDAEDAQLQYLGVTVTRGSNDIADLVPGVRITLLDTTDAPVGVTLSRDDEAIESRVQELVDSYNTFKKFINDQYTVNPATNRGGPLLGDSLIRRVDQRVRETFTRAYDFGDISATLSTTNQLGLELQKDGLLEFNTADFRERLAEDPNAVREFLSGKEVDVEGEDETVFSNGFATTLASALEDIVRPDGNFFTAREGALDDRIESLDLQIERLENRLVDREEFLVRQFSQLESLISTIRTQSGFLGGQ